MSRILIYDSGVGNIPIANAIRAELPSAELLLVSDTAFFPYGEKEDGELILRAINVLHRAVSELEPDLLVLGCNTLSTIALEDIRNEFRLPIVGVVPAIKPAASLSQSKVIGLIATPATIHREYTEQLISEFAADCSVIKVGSTDLVRLAEDKVSGKQVDKNQLRNILLPFVEARGGQSLDQLVLGCTHFPLLKDEISTLLEDIEIQDSSAAIGKQVHKIVSTLSKNKIIKKTSILSNVYYSTNMCGNIISTTMPELSTKV